MEDIWVGDLEADGLLNETATAIEATQVWCGVFKNIHTLEIKKFYPVPFEGGDPYYLHNMIEFMKTAPTIVMHNGLQYDFPLLEKLYGYKYEGNKIDTIIWSRMLKPKRATPFMCPVKNRPHSILAWGYRVGLGKPDHNDWSQFSMDMLHRCTQDVEIGCLVYNELLKEMEGYEWDNASWLNHRLFDILGKQEQLGWLVDREWMDYTIHMATRWINKIDLVLAPRLPLVLVIKETKTKGIYKYVQEPFLKSGKYKANVINWFNLVGWIPEDKIVGGPFSRVLYRPLDPASRVESIAYLLNQGWIPKLWNTDDQGEKTSPKLTKDDPFEGVQGREGKLLAKRVQIRHRRSSVEGLVKLIRSDGRIASRITNLAETGRATHGGIVNIPNLESFMGRWMRKIFICPSDKVLVSVDSAGCQNRMLAARVGDPIFTKILIEGKKENKTSIHHVNQSHVNQAGFNITYGLAKNLNYAFMFGASDNKLGTMVGGTSSDGDRVRQALLGVSPGFAVLVESITKEWRSHAKERNNKWNKKEYFDGWIRGLDGRPIFIDSEHKLLVYLLQSDEAILMTTAYVLLYDWCESRGYVWGTDWGYVCFYHDEYTAEVSPEIAEDFKFLGERAIAVAGQMLEIACPHVGEGNIGKNWSEVH